MNVEADESSRFSDERDVEDHSLGKKWCEKICRWGGIKPAVDAFANAQNAKEERCGAMNKDDKCTHVCSVTVHPLTKKCMRSLHACAWSRFQGSLRKDCDKATSSGRC